MTLTQLRYLVAIADTGLNITQAAERVHATQPGISKQIRQLEDELGFLLFQRRGRSLESITPAGREVLAHARRVLAETGNIRAYAANERGDTQGRLSLVTTHTQARFVLPPAIAVLAARYPGVSIELRPAAEGEVLAQLVRGDADFAVVSTAGDAPPGGLAVPLYRWRRVVLVPADHALAQRRQAPDLAELATLPLLSYESSNKPESSLRRAFAQAGLVPQLALTARDADLIKTYVRAGLGVGLLAEMAVSATHDTDLHRLPAPAEIPTCTCWAVLPRERVLRDHALALLQAIAPNLDAHDIQRAVAGNDDPAWPEPPAWRDGSLV